MRFTYLYRRNEEKRAFCYNTTPIVSTLQQTQWAITTTQRTLFFHVVRTYIISMTSAPLGQQLIAKNPNKTWLKLCKGNMCVYIYATCKSIYSLFSLLIKKRDKTRVKSDARGGISHTHTKIHCQVVAGPKCLKNRLS